MKKLLSVFLIGLMLLSNFTFITFAEDEVTDMVNGEKLVSDVPAQSIEVYDDNGTYIGDRTMLPLRAISEKLNCDVYWNEETSGITIYRKDNLYIMWLENDTAFFLNGVSLGKGYRMDVPPTTINERTLVPVRAVAELLGAEVNWKGDTNTVDIKYELGELETNSGLAEQCKIYEVLLKKNYETYCNLANGTLGTVTGKIVLESGKEMKFELYPEIAPESCKKFIECAKEGFYEDTIFHRVIKDFVAQGGGCKTNGNLVYSGKIIGEFVKNGFFNLIPHNRGALSFARADDYDSGSSQFFICHKDSAWLNGLYAAFGKVTEGLDVLDEICNVQTDENDKPINPIVVKTVVIDD